MIVVGGHAELFQVVEAMRAPRSFAGGLNSRQ
jgi:hypothetical protein